MNVIYASDDNYSWLAGISMLSLFENNKERDEIQVFLFCDKVSKRNKEYLSAIAWQYQRKLEFIDVSQLRLPDFLYSGRWPMSACSRLFACELLPGIDKALYLDCDIIVDGDISDLYDWPMGENILLAVKDCVSSAHKHKIGLQASDVYINTGVLLMDLQRVRDFPMKESIAAFVQRYGKVVMYPDQDITNCIFKGQIGILPPEYNVMTQFNQYSYEQLKWIRHPSYYYSRQEIETAKRHARIFHYTTCMLNIRPWYSGSKLNNAHVFNRYMDISPWKGVQKGVMKFSGSRYMTLRLLSYLPTCLMNFSLGMLHAYIKPYYMMVSATLSKCKVKVCCFRVVNMALGSVKCHT